jgi:probable F420-dependent oxidoreductase
VKIGVFSYNTHEGLPPSRLAREVEERGFESFWLPEHTHIPTAQRSPFPGGGPMPEWYKSQGDPWIGLAAAAAVTRTIRLGTNVALVPEHDPITLAKTIASLDQLSEGRVIVGAGFGWNREELADHGVAFETRRELFREKVEAMRALWTQEEASYEGRYVRFAPCWQYPKPRQRPCPPIVLGAGSGPKALAAVIDGCDGWMPPVPVIGEPHFFAGLEALRRRAEEAGRNPDTIEVSTPGVEPDERVLARFAAVGVARAILVLPPPGGEEALALLDAWCALVSRLVDAPQS